MVLGVLRLLGTQSLRAHSGFLLFYLCSAWASHLQQCCPHSRWVFPVSWFTCQSPLELDMQTQLRVYFTNAPGVSQPSETGHQDQLAQSYCHGNLHKEQMKSLHVFIAKTQVHTEQSLNTSKIPIFPVLLQRKYALPRMSSLFPTANSYRRRSWKCLSFFVTSSDPKSQILEKAERFFKCKDLTFRLLIFFPSFFKDLFILYT